MCTAIRYQNSGHYFGRNLDLEYSYKEQVVITPRGRKFTLRSGGDFTTRYALIGMATVLCDYPLYYEAANEAGLAAAGLNLPGLARYFAPQEGKKNITPFEFLPWLLGQASDLSQARSMLEDLNLTDISFAPELPLSPLHFMISDRTGSLVVEQTEDGLHIYENPFDVLTNNPPFDFQQWNMRQYANLSAQNQPSRFGAGYPLNDYGVGLGAFGLPGDATGPSRFVRAAFHLANSRCDANTGHEVSQFFHILDSVSMLKGSTLTHEGKDDITLYSSCIDLDNGVFYYKTYNNSQVTAIRMDHVDLNSPELFAYDLILEPQIKAGN